MLSETIDLLNSFLQAQIAPMSMLDVFIEYISPILQLIVILGGAGAGLYKYYRTKNREIYEKLLSEVYAPLYQYIVKQELYRKLIKYDADYKNTPIIELISKKTTSNASGMSTSTEPVLGLNRTDYGG